MSIRRLILSTLFIFCLLSLANFPAAQLIESQQLPAGASSSHVVAISKHFSLISNPGKPGSSISESTFLYGNNADGSCRLLQALINKDHATVGGDLFGHAMDITEKGMSITSTIPIPGSGYYAVVDAPHIETDSFEGNRLPYAGAAYIFEEQDDKTWTQTAKLVAPDRASYSLFGGAVSIQSDYVSISSL